MRRRAPARAAGEGAPGETIVLALPANHCAGCIAGVERTLRAHPGVRAARVDLGLRRVRAMAAPGTGTGAAPLLAAPEAAGYDAHERDGAAVAPGDAAGRDLLARIAVSGFAMMNVMMLSVTVRFDADAATRALFRRISAAIALPAVAFAAMPFVRSALAALTARRMSMDVPIALAIALACATSLYETALGGRHA